MVKFVNIILAETHPNKEAAASIRSQRAIQHKLLKHNPDVKWQTPRVRFPFLSVSSPGVFILFYSFLFCFILFAMQRYYFFLINPKKNGKLTMENGKLSHFVQESQPFLLK